jgi:TolB-like protein/Flp pilus assembly protein TadD
MSLMQELKKRNIFRVVVFYLVSAWVILQVGTLLTDIMELPIEWKKGLLLLLIVGFPVALITSWVFEVTPDGVKLESDISGAEAKQSKSAQRMNIATIVVVVLGISLLGFDRFFSNSSKTEEPAATIAPTTTAEQNTPIIAVLPFFASGSDDGGFLATGLHDDLLTRLARLNAFKVISRTSMMEYAQTTKNMREIGEELGAGYILQGGVQVLGVRVRINAQLIDAQTDQHLWAETYDRELTALDLFDIQADLARAIAAKLSLTLSGTDTARIDSIPTESIIAYNAYLRAIELKDRRGLNTETSLLVIETLEKSVETDPKFADAWALLSIEQSRYVQTTIDGDQEKYARAALASRAKAFTLDPELPEGIVADAVYQYRVLNEYQNALDLLTELELTYPLPAPVVSLKSFLLRRLGNFESAYQTLKLAYELDPRSVNATKNIIILALTVGRCQEANTFLLQALSMAPNNAGVLTGAAVYEMSCTGDIDQAAQYIEHPDYKDSDIFTALRVAEIQSDYNRILDLSRVAGKFNSAQTSNILRAGALKGLGRHAEAETVIEEIRQALFRETSNNAEVSLTEQEKLTFLKLQFMRLEQDQAGVTDMVKEHKRLLNLSTKGDKYFEQVYRLYYVEAFVDAGLKDHGVAELETYFASPGSFPFLYVDIYPMFASLKGHPRYEALREKYATVD